ncbi:zinc finger protein 474 [Nesidiocoris tenuis]|uniref:Zinc finger protein 474 n=1 Tax=Nesidiocoris tenuis TaxID=355587 RepID=A0ABN7ACG2_9HEMI|nr:zinc finger protein 474 [Nesidiocoris tenuis]
MIRGSDAGSATVVRPTTAKLSRPQIMDPSWSLNIDMTTIQLSTLEEVETVLTKPRRLHLQATVAAATKKRGGRKSVARPLGNNSSTNKKITSNKIPVAVDFLPQEVAGQVPIPCKTCTKNNEPERFHSHPRTAHLGRRLNSSNALSESSVVTGASPAETLGTVTDCPTRKAITKPVPLKFRSGKANGGTSTGNSSTISNNNIRKVHVEMRDSSTSLLPTTAQPPVAKPLPARLVVSKVLAPVNLKMAYDHSLLYCKKCGKTFGNDDELRLHVESCDVQWTELDSELENASGAANGNDEDQYKHYKLRLQPCSICGRKFQQKRIETHEAACRKVKHSSSSK